MLRAEHLRLALGERAVLRDASISLTTREVVAVMGVSGSGKSSLLLCLAGILKPDAGEVWFGDVSVGGLGERARSRLRLRHFGFVFQFGDLVPELTIGENVALPLRLLGMRARPARAAAVALMARLGIEELAGRATAEVSGGELQRAAVARALVHRPAVVFADEPTGAVDEQNRDRVLDEFVTLAREQASAVVLVTHDAEVARVADRVLCLRDGALTEGVSPP